LQKVLKPKRQKQFQKLPLHLPHPLPLLNLLFLFYPLELIPKQLQLVQDQVKARAAQRGILGSGLEMEDLGRAGVELAIREAESRENFRQQQLSNFMSLFGLGQNLRSREIGVEEAATNLQAGRESNLTQLLQGQTGNAVQSMLDLLGTQTGRAEGLRDMASALREAERQSREQFFGDLVMPGGSFSIPGTGMSVSLPSGGSAFPSTAPVSSLVSAQQVPGGGGGFGTQSTVQPGSLSRRQSNDDDLLKQLAALFGGSA